MDRIIEKLDSGWWIVSHEQKLWLPHGELPYGDAARFDLIGQRALPIGEWEGNCLAGSAAASTRYGVGAPGH